MAKLHYKIYMQISWCDLWIYGHDLLHVSLWSSDLPCSPVSTLQHIFISTICYLPNLNYHDPKWESTQSSTCNDQENLLHYTPYCTSGVCHVSFSSGSAPFNCFLANSFHSGSSGWLLSDLEFEIHATFCELIEWMVMAQYFWHGRFQKVPDIISISNHHFATQTPTVSQRPEKS